MLLSPASARSSRLSPTKVHSSAPGPLLPVHDRQLLEELQPVSRFVPRPAASECRAVVISAQRSAALDPRRPSALLTLEVKIAVIGPFRPVGVRRKLAKVFTSNLRHQTRGVGRKIDVVPNKLGDRA
jgi:hypothetical protein